MQQSEAYEMLCREYLSKCHCCDECVAEFFCITEGLKRGREPESDCIEKLKSYYRAAKIAVGDEVIYHNDRGVVTMIANNGQDIMALSAKGGWLIRANRDEVKKTGRSFPEVEELLDKLKEGKDD